MEIRTIRQIAMEVLLDGGIDVPALRIDVRSQYGLLRREMAYAVLVTLSRTPDDLTEMGPRIERELGHRLAFLGAARFLVYFRRDAPPTDASAHPLNGAEWIDTVHLGL